MPAKSKSQQKAAGAALAAKLGETKQGALKGASQSMYDSMTEEQLRDMAAAKRKGKPEHVSKSRHACHFRGEPEEQSDAQPSYDQH